MKITKRQLRRIIKEEKQKIISEQVTGRDGDTLEKIIEELKGAVELHRSQHERLQTILDRLRAGEED